MLISFRDHYRKHSGSAVVATSTSRKEERDNFRIPHHPPHRSCIVLLVRVEYMLQSVQTIPSTWHHSRLLFPRIHRLITELVLRRLIPTQRCHDMRSIDEWRVLAISKLQQIQQHKGGSSRVYLMKKQIQKCILIGFR